MKDFFDYLQGKLSSLNREIEKESAKHESYLRIKNDVDMYVACGFKHEELTVVWDDEHMYWEVFTKKALEN